MNLSYCVLLGFAIYKMVSSEGIDCLLWGILGMILSVLLIVEGKVN